MKVITMHTEINRSVEERTDALQIQAGADNRAVLELEGMACASCAMRIEKGLKKVPGVKDANVNLATELATVTYDPAQTGLEQMVQKVEAVGYKATPQVAPQRKSVQETAASIVPETLDTQVFNISQEDVQSKRKRAEIIRKRNLLILGI